MKKFRIAALVLCIAAAVIFSGFINISGGIALCFFVESSKQDYFNFGLCLFGSTAFLTAGTVIACFKKVWLPLIFNIVGTVLWIYTAAGLYAIPASLIPKQQTEPLAERHLLTVIVTVLLLTVTAFNFLDEENAEKRRKKRMLKEEAENRALSEEEKII